jgi:hypothetical protein
LLWEVSFIGSEKDLLLVINKRNKRNEMYRLVHSGNCARIWSDSLGRNLSRHKMKIPIWICSLLFASVLALQSWMLAAIVDLKADTAATKAALEIILNKKL